MVDIDDRASSLNVRFFGYISEIQPGVSENKSTHFAIRVVGRIGLAQKNHCDPS